MFDHLLEYWWFYLVIAFFYWDRLLSGVALLGLTTAVYLFGGDSAFFVVAVLAIFSLYVHQILERIHPRFRLSRLERESNKMYLKMVKGVESYLEDVINNKIDLPACYFEEAERNKYVESVKLLLLGFKELRKTCIEVSETLRHADIRKRLEAAQDWFDYLKLSEKIRENVFLSLENIGTARESESEWEARREVIKQRILKRGMGGK